MKMNKQIWRSADTQKPCMCSFCAPTTTKSYKMSPQMPLFIPITSKISANNNNLNRFINLKRVVLYYKDAALAQF